MKKLLFLTLLSCTLFTIGNAQETSGSEKYGKTLNLGAGIGYYRYVGHALPYGTLNYEFDVARNFTLAPFAGIYTYQDFYWDYGYKPNGDPTYEKYYYPAIAVPIGVKGTYYFDELFQANSKWDFYAAGSAGIVLRNGRRYGERTISRGPESLYLDLHIGAEYHITNKTGFFLDLSSGVSTIGFALHF